ncbi:beta-alanyl-bioamine nonribosomal peptide synthetase ebony [Halyomorpha halys]|uniref:beta-alanyl-bioamine nonribosomal peptide synthetase ebony n=1 Tax=Halyomorpha halys TaxID=286706 RepID=UPI0006D4CE98|nr:uncharacterized protein LOC106681698 [Halyomorpha halys]
MGSIPQVSLLRGLTEESRFRGKRPSQLFSDLAGSHPDAIALIWEDEGAAKRYEMTMEQLDRESNKIARGILNHCGQLVAPNNDGDRVVMIYLPPSWKLVCTILAIWKAGACYLPVVPPAPKDRVKHMLQEAKPFLVITDWDDEEELFSDVNTISWTSLEEISIDLSDGLLSSGESYPMTNDPIEIILYTSGSTGLSKGVRIKSSSILNRLEWQWREFPFSKEEETCCFKTSITFVDSVAEIWAPLLNPEHPLPVLVLPRSTSSNPQLLIPLLNNYKVGRLVLVPTLLKSILTYLKITNDNTSLKQLKTWVCSGETLPCSLAEEFFDWSEINGGSHMLCNFYGSTEIMGDVTFHVMKNKQHIGDRGKVPIGGPVDNTILYLLDAQMRLVNSGEIGELYVSGKHVAAGYVNGRDSFRFIESTLTVDPEYKTLFKTGDYASIYKGTLLFEGRTDSQVKVRGNRVDLSEIETALNKLQEVQKGVVLCYNPGQTDQELVAFVLLNEGVLSESADIQKLLSKSLPSYAIPQVTMMDQIPLLVNGKVDRQQLLHHYSQLADVTNGMDFDLNGLIDEKRPAMKCLLSTIASVLPHAISKLSPEANFYNIGGNSLNSVLTIAKLSEAGYNINVVDFIRSETLLDIVNKMTPKSNGMRHSNKKVSNKYKYDQIAEKYKPDVYRIITDSFLNKADIESTMEPPVEKHDYIELLDAIWPTLVNNPLSIVVKDANTDDVISTSLVMDTIDEPPVKLQSQLNYVFQFLEYLEVPVMETMLPKGKILHSFMLGTDQRLSPQENIEITEAMEWKIEDLARQNSFIGIFTTNTSPLTRQLSEAVLNYKQLKSYQVNQFVAPDGTRPFKRGDDSLIATCAFKEVY